MSGFFDDALNTGEIGFPTLMKERNMGCDNNDMDRREENRATKTVETVNHPAHYGGDTTYEVIKVIRAWGLDANFCLGNVIKYIARDADKKANAIRVKTLTEYEQEHRRVRELRLNDLKKAAWYLNDEIKAMEKELQK